MKPSMFSGGGRYFGKLVDEHVGVQHDIFCQCICPFFASSFQSCQRKEFEIQSDDFKVSRISPIQTSVMKVGSASDLEFSKNDMLKDFKNLTGKAAYAMRVSFNSRKWIEYTPSIGHIFDKVFKRRQYNKYGSSLLKTQKTLTRLQSSKQKSSFFASSSPIGPRPQPLIQKLSFLHL